MNKTAVNRKLIAWVFLITGIVSGILWWRENKAKLEVKSWGEPLHISYRVEVKKLSVDKDTSRETTKLISQLTARLNGETDKYAVYVFRLKEKNGYGFSETEKFPAASIMKVPIMTAVLRKIETGDLKLEDTYVLKDSDKESGSGPLEFLESGTVLSVEDLLRVTGKNSDNTAPAILARMVGQDWITDTMQKLMMTDSSFSDNSTTAFDIAVMWKKLEEGQIITAEHWQLMQSFLTDSIYEDRISLGLPKEISFIHKVGSGDGVWADGGIIQYSNSPFILVILNKEIDQNLAKDVVPEMAKMVWDFESSRSVKTQ